MTGLEITSGAVEQQAARIRTHGEDYGAAPGSLRARGDGVSSWGDCGLFSTITSVYAECRETSMAVLDELHTAIGSTGDGLYETVKNIRDVEAANTAAAEELGRQWL
ncbi:hypothetical protein [Streptosporangium sp. NPDC000396]|uniref:hypothetical protein n=1 Tax=Streptosporangium sp. NPDC000396 TaxID=3366185 RepID=UPI00367E7FD8